jgi:hypothetical protein
MTAAGSMIPVRPLAAQAHALHAAAAFIERAGISGLCLTVSQDRGGRQAGRRGGRAGSRRPRLGHRRR